MDHRTKPDSPQNMLVHYGIRGMRWGERKAQRQHLRSLDRASKARDRASDNAAIDSARARLASGKTERDLRAAKAKYKADRKVIGKREAKKALFKAREKAIRDIELAETTKHGSERTGAVLGLVGAAVVVAGVNAAAISALR